MDIVQSDAYNIGYSGRRYSYKKLDRDRRSDRDQTPILDRALSGSSSNGGASDQILGESAPPEWALLLIGCLLGLATGLCVAAFNCGVEKYTEGLCWVLKYYFSGVASWTCAHAFPEAYRSLMSGENSEIIDFYPTDGKRFKWQGVCKLPFIDEQRLLFTLVYINFLFVTVRSLKGVTLDYSNASVFEYFQDQETLCVYYDVPPQIQFVPRLLEGVNVPMKAPYCDPRTKLRYANTEVFKLIRSLPNDYV